jgi:hypothetical protein
MWRWRARWPRTLFVNVKSEEAIERIFPVRLPAAFGTVALVLLALVATGAALDWLRPEPSVERSAAAEPRLSVSPGAGALLGWLGGFRALTADFVWLRMHAFWETRDLERTESLIALTTMVDPRPLFFWLNGARILAYDLPAWRIEAAGGYDLVSVERQRAIDVEQARLALRRIAAARQIYRTSATLWVEQANIELNRLRDVSAAAESYRRAAEQPDAPYYAGRMYAELLRKLDRKPEAYAWLRALHPRLPLDDESAGAAVVLGRIRDLERELAVTSAQSYRPRQP